MPKRPTAKMRKAKAKLTPSPHGVATQIAVTSNQYGDSGRVVESVTVLMDDGSIWRYPMVGADPENRVWVQLPAVGQTASPVEVKE